jgi:ribose 5-phosphate isomerase B
LLKKEEKWKTLEVITMIAIGSDHGGYALKEHIKAYLTSKGISCMDVGCDSPESCDYPIFGKAVGEAVASGKCEKGIVICTTGIGISISANKVKGVRAALCADSFTAEMTRRHNDSNVLALGAGIVGPNLADRIVDVFLSTEFEGGRHERRVNLMMDIEK